ncbi:MAG: hypothetical protein ABSH38_02225 [Verrucomicrobiota bacterium]|jgi:hypothetical protein
MSNEKMKKKSGWGGWRKNAGRKPRPGGTVKICVSLNEQNWQAARNQWKKKPSWLVDWLVSDYIKTGGSLLKSEAVL